MDPDSSGFWRLKIAAFLHDPPHKALLLGTKTGHESVASDLIELAGGTPDWNLIRNADRIAAAADRQGIPSQSKAYWSQGAQALLRHPLSAESFSLGTLAAVDPFPKTELLKDVITRARNRHSDARTMFFYLWRSLADDLKRAEAEDRQGEPLGALWDLLPADTRLPNHTIWHHNRVVSAVAGALSHPALLVVALGPVQPFIAAARKARDLWAGSFLLSHLAWSAMQPIAERFGPDAILFPDLRRQPAVDRWLADFGLSLGDRHTEQALIASLPNRYVALVPAAETASLIRRVEEAVRTSSQDIAKTVLAEASLAAVAPDLVERQLRWLEVYGVILNWPEYSDASAARISSELERMLGPDGSFSGYLAAARGSEFFRPNLGTFYGRFHKLAENFMGSRKALRDFSQGAPEAGYKCTLCGEREPLHPPEATADDLGASRRFWKRFASDCGATSINPDGSERLCAVCATKRFLPRAFERELSRDLAGAPSAAFPSTSEIATTSFKVAVLRRLETDAALREQLDAFITAWPSDALSQHSTPFTKAVERALGRSPSGSARKFARLDGEWLFDERYADDGFATGDAFDPERFAECRDKLRSLHLAASRTGIPNPSPYYAIVVFDGDRMGEWVSGEHENLPTLGDMLQSPTAIDESQRSMRPPTSPSLQSAISAALAGFALGVVPYVVERQGPGRVIYAGGDDLLAMLPLSGLLETAIGLREGFRNAALLDFNGHIHFGEEALRRAGSGGWIHLGMGRRATASAGIAVAHHLHPLPDVLEQARDAEQVAKNEAGRDAFCLKVLKRSGETTKTYAHWRWASFLQAIIRLFRAHNGLSPRIIQRLEVEGAPLADHPDLRDARISIIRAALQRQERAESLATLIREQFPDSASPEPFSLLAARIEALATETQWSNALALLSAAQFIARHTAEETGRDNS